MEAWRRVPISEGRECLVAAPVGNEAAKGKTTNQETEDTARGRVTAWRRVMIPVGEGASVLTRTNCKGNTQ